MQVLTVALLSLLEQPYGSRYQGALDSSNRQWQDNFSKDMSWFKVDNPQVVQTSTLVPESSLLPGLTPNFCPLRSLLPTGRQV